MHFYMVVNGYFSFENALAPVREYGNHLLFQLGNYTEQLLFSGSFNNGKGAVNGIMPF